MRGTVVPQQVDFLVECGCGDTTRWVIWRNHALGGKANSYRSRKQTRIFQHFGRLFLPGTIQNVPCSLNELLVNFREESSGIGRFCRLEVPTDGQLAAQFRPFYRNWVNCTKQAVCFEQFSQFRLFHRSWASWPFVGIRAYKIGQSHWIPLENRPAAH